MSPLAKTCFILSILLLVVSIRAPYCSYYYDFGLGELGDPYGSPRTNYQELFQVPDSLSWRTLSPELLTLLSNWFAAGVILLAPPSASFLIRYKPLLWLWRALIGCYGFHVIYRMDVAGRAAMGSYCPTRAVPDAGFWLYLFVIYFHFAGLWLVHAGRKSPVTPSAG